MPKPLSYEALFAALTVVGAAACSKAAPSAAKAEPAAEAVPSATASPGAPPAPPPVATDEKEKTDKDSLNAPAPAVAAPSAKAVGATEPPKKPAARSMNKPKGNAACGAGTCSDEMKK